MRLATLTEEEVIRLADECRGCGVCEARCPGGVNRRLLFAYIRLGDWDSASKASRNCVACNICEEVCPWKLPGAYVVDEVRWKRPRGELGEALDLIVKAGNPLGQLHEHRLRWAEELRLKAKPNHVARDLLGRCALFTGCMYSYREAEAARAAYRLLVEAGVEVHLSPMEWCCGFLLVRAGLVERASEAASRNVEAYESMEVDTLITLCPACDATWRRDYPALIGRPRFRVVHFTEALELLFREGVVEAASRLKASATFHDPCHLARGPARLVEQPRSILKMVEGLDYVEMLRWGARTRCCGSTLRLYEYGAVRRLSELRVRDAEKVGAELLVTMCPFCHVNLSGAAKRLRSKVKVVELPSLMERVGVRRVEG
ncbi:MAG: hypothetical protein DRJ97_08500 [Thermoprotei archaeon]|nr:MAG: hypothetical protein DRJ97_08500 [Thermoprotei archaeon]